jgi:RNA polymerase sigma factor (sigma-70 family)
LEKADNLDAYARRCAINLAFDWRRKNMCDTLRLDDVREPGTNEDSPPAKLIEREQLEEALEAIGQLSDLCRAAFVMRYIEQQSYEQVAKELGKEPHQVRGLCSKATTRLRNLLSKHNGGMR